MKENFQNIQEFFKMFQKSLLPRKPLTKFWSLDVFDFLAFLVMIFPTLLIWLYTAYKSSIYSILEYWDGPNYIYVAMTLYSIPDDNLWTITFDYKPSYFACHLPGYPMLIRLCTFFTCGNYFYGSFLSIIINNFILAYTFRRLLIAYHCSQSQFFSTCLLAIIPFRLVVYRAVLASEPLFISFVCLSFIFYKFNMKSFMIISVWACCLTRIEGMAVGFVIGLCYLIQFDLIHALMMFVTFIPDLFLMYVHYVAFRDPLAYIHFNSNEQNIMTFVPFSDLFSPPKWSRFNGTNTLFMYFVPLIGIVTIFPNAGPKYLFCSEFYIYVSMLFHLDTSRYMIPCSVFAYIIGFNNFLARFPTKLSCCLVYLIAIIILTYYTGNQIQSNKCQRSFLMSVLKSNNYMNI